jgi:hypothetical protein
MPGRIQQYFIIDWLVGNSRTPPYIAFTVMDISRTVDRRSSRIRLPGDHDGGAGTTQLGQIAICSHADRQGRVLAANDRTIEVWL